MCSNVSGSALTPATCMPALVREGVLAHVGLVRIRLQVEHLRDQVRRLGQPLQRRQARVAQLELQVRDDRDQVRVAAALAVAVHGPLDHHGALGDRRRAYWRPRTRRRCGCGCPAPRPAARAARRTDRGGHLVRQRGAVGVAHRQVLGARLQRGASGTPSRTRVVEVPVEEVLGVVDRRACRRRPGTRPTRRSSAGSRRDRRARPSPGAGPRSCRRASTPASTTPRGRAAPCPPRPRLRAGASSRTRKCPRRSPASRSRSKSSSSFGFEVGKPASIIGTPSSSRIRATRTFSSTDSDIPSPCIPSRRVVS